MFSFEKWFLETNMFSLGKEMVSRYMWSSHDGLSVGLKIDAN
jgi:hypothetical protein